MHIGIDAMGDYAHNIPTMTPTVLGYDTGSGGVQWNALQYEGFPHSGIGHINQDNDTNPRVGSIFDMESGAGTTGGFVEWSRGKRALGLIPIGYGSRSTLTAAAEAMLSAGINDWWEWEANPMGDERAAAQLLTGRVKAVQFAWPQYQPHMIVPGSHLTLSQANVDISICADDFFPPPHSHIGPSGTPAAHVTVNLDNGRWTAHGTPGDWTRGDKSEWEEAHVGFNVHTGEWRIMPLGVRQQ